jgi:hypothetical protein
MDFVSFPFHVDVTEKRVSRMDSTSQLSCHVNDNNVRAFPYGFFFVLGRVTQDLLGIALRRFDPMGFHDKRHSDCSNQHVLPEEMQ